MVSVEATLQAGERELLWRRGLWCSGVRQGSLYSRGKAVERCGAGGGGRRAARRALMAFGLVCVSRSGVCVEDGV